MFRWFALAVFVASLIISAWRRGQARRAGGAIPRSAETRGLIAGRIFVALPLFGGVVAYIMNPRWMAWASLGLPSWVRWAGVVLMAANGFILLWAWVALIALRLVVVPREEAHLVAAFGDAYRRYRTSTGSLLPSLPGIWARHRPD